MYQESLDKLRENLVKKVYRSKENKDLENLQLGQIEESIEELRKLGNYITSGFINNLLDEHNNIIRNRFSFLETEYTNQIFNRRNTQIRAKRLINKIYIEDKEGIYQKKTIFSEIDNTQKVNVDFISMNKEKYATIKTYALASMNLIDDLRVIRIRHKEGCLINSVISYKVLNILEKNKKEVNNENWAIFVLSKKDNIREAILEIKRNKDKNSLGKTESKAIREETISKATEQFILEHNL